jgi:carbon-monoxide dehydrogenase iron sulfur subunit
MKFKIGEKQCTGCQLCQLACSSSKAKGLGLGLSLIQILFHREKATQRIKVCRQCASCRCMAACQYNAFKRDEKTRAVFIAESECQACLVCLDTCPFDAVFMDPKKGLPMVCDLCQGHPACVEICPAGVLATVETREC